MLSLPQRHSARIAGRRGLVLVLMSLIVPGSAQVAAGNKKVGRVALSVWMTLVAVLIVVGIATLVARSAVIGVLASPVTLTILSWLVPVLGVCWLLLLVNAWWLAGPRNMAGAGRALTGVLAFVLAVSLGWASWGAHTVFGASAQFVSAVFAGGGTSMPDANGRYNVLLIGGDAGADRTGIRPDSMTVASVDAATGRTVLIGLPRNMQHVPFPADSPLHKLYPNGYWCSDQSCLLNAVYTLAENHKDLFPGVQYPGVVATEGVIEQITGLTINYWVMIDLAGFQNLIDAVGGIRLNIPQAVPIGSLDTKYGITGWIKPGKNVHLNGYNALWFARSREYASDYVRMARQKCVLNAMLKQLNPTTVVTKFQAIASASGATVATDLSPSQLGTMIDLASKARSLPMAALNLTPPLVTPANPDFSKVKTLVANAIATSQAADKHAAGGQASKPAPASATASSSDPQAPASASSDELDTGNLDTVCSVS